MTVKDLMIDDIISHKGCVYRVKGVYGNTGLIDLFPCVLKNKEGLYLTPITIQIKDCDPIPLTEKVLKDNGFKKQELTIGNYALFLKEKGKYDIRSALWGNVFNGRIDIGVLGNYVCVKKEFIYVHELQHALRLCGLVELADNFKVG